MSEHRSYRLAPMCGLIGGLTLAMLALPVLVAAGFLEGLPAPALWLPAGIALLYLSIWLWWRPSRFELDASGLTIRWPLRRQHIPWHQIREARALRSLELRDELGFAARIGAGGLWGGFGWVWSSRRGLLDLYVSRTDGMVMIERRPGRALLITPEQPREFASAVRAKAASV
jgi:hypothetical protein